MSKFWMVTEDPEYDEDGSLVDDEQAALDAVEELDYARTLVNFDPFETVNS